MRYILILVTSIAIVMTSLVFALFAFAYPAHAQIVPAQNQIIIAPYGAPTTPGYVVSTSTTGTRKLEATTTPYFSNFFAGTGTLQNFILGTLNGVLYAVNGVVKSVATTTVSCSGTVACSSFDVFGSSPITLIGSGSGGSSAFEIATTSTIAVPQLAYFTKASGRTTLGGAATTTLAGTGVTSVSNAPFVIGASPSVVSLIGGTGGQILAWANGAANWIASTTFSAPLVFSAGNVTCTNASAGVTGCLTGTDYTTFNNKLGSYDAFTHAQLGQSATTSAIGIGTTTPYAQLSVSTSTQSAAATPLFAVGSTTNTVAPLLVVLGNGFIGLGTTTPLLHLDISGTDSTTAALGITRYSTDALPPGFIGRKARGTNASPSAVASGDSLATFVGRGYATTIFSGSVGAMDIRAAQDFTDTAMGSNITWDTTNLGAIVRTEKARLTASGNFGVATTTPYWPLTAASSTGPQLTLTDASATNAPYNQRVIGSFFTFSTSSPLTFATTSYNFLKFDSLTGSTTLGKLDVTGAATSSFSGGLNLLNGCFAINNVCVAASGLTSYDAWTHPTDFNITTSATGTPIWGQAGIFASSSSAYPTVAVLQSGAGAAASFKGGNVGIGTTSPTKLLVVTGDQTGGIARIHRINVSTSGVLGTYDILGESTGTMTDGFGVAQTFSTEDVTGGPTIVGQLAYQRHGANNTSTGVLYSYNAGSINQNASLLLDGLVGASGIGTTTPQWTLTLASSTRPQLTLTDTTATNPPFNLRTLGNYLTFSTSSPVTFATTSSSFAQFDSTTASSTFLKLDKIGTATSTFNGGLFISAGGLTIPGIVSSLTLTNASGNFIPYTGATCTNQFVRIISAAGAATCATVGAADVSLANLTATDSTLTFSGTYNGSTARTIGLNLANANTWTVLQTYTVGVGVPGIVSNSLVGIGTSTPKWSLQVASSTGPQLALSDGSLTSDHWTFRSINGNLYISTSSPLTFASSTQSTTAAPFAIIKAGIAGLFGFSTSTPWATVGINATPGLPSFAIGSSTATQVLVNSLGQFLLGTTTAPASYAMIASTTLASSEEAVATSSTTNIDFGKSNQSKVYLGNSAVTITFSNLYSGTIKRVITCNPITGTAGALTWPGGATLVWQNGTTPTQNTTAQKCEIYQFSVTNGTSTQKVLGTQITSF